MVNFPLKMQEGADEPTPSPFHLAKLGVAFLLASPVPCSLYSTIFLSYY